MQSDYLNKKQALLTYLHQNNITGPTALQKKTSNLFRNKLSSNNKKLDLSNFNQVIRIDTQNNVAEVEGLITYASLVAETLKYNRLPAVVPELKTITVGGAYVGIGIESSALHYGLVHETISECEVLLANGSIITCTPENEHKELFFALPNSYGCFGYVLKLKLKLITTKPYVKLTHLRYHNFQDLFTKLNNICQKNKLISAVDYIDGVIFSPTEMYITLGEFVASVPKQNISNYKYLNIYYQSIRCNNSDYLTTSDYIWRWDTDWFWCSKIFFLQNPVVRFIFGKFCLNSKTYFKIRALINSYPILQRIINYFRAQQEVIVQDVEIPIENCSKFMEFFTNTIKISPIWVCPIIPYNANASYPLYKMQPNKLYINFGFWDTIASNQAPGFYNKLIEAKVTELKGNKSLYSDVYYDEPTFWSIYDKDLYEKLKAKYGAKNLFHLCTLG